MSVAAWLLLPATSLSVLQIDKASGKWAAPPTFWFFSCIEMLSYHRVGESHISRNCCDRLLLYRVPPANFVNDVHIKHSRYLRFNRPMVAHWGGNYWTLFPPLIWVVLHVVLQCGLIACNFLQANLGFFWVNLEASLIARFQNEVPPVFRLPRGGVHATSFSFCWVISQSSRNRIGDL